MAQPADDFFVTDKDKIIEDGDMVHLADVLDACMHIGKLLQGIPKTHRKLAVSRFANETTKLHDNGHQLAAMMVGLVAGSWDAFDE